MISKTRFGLSVLIIITMLIYLPTLTYGFIWDDFNYILNNKNLDLPYWRLWTFDQSLNPDYWPVSYTIFKLIKTHLGTLPIYFKATTLLIFSLTITFLYKILLKLRIEHAFFITLLFTVHPMNVSLVVWAFQLKTNLAILFYLISFYFLILCTESNLKKSKKIIFFYILCIFFFTISLLSKIMFVLMPFFYLFYFVFKGNNYKAAVIKSIPFFVVSLFLGWINVFWYKNQIPLMNYERLTESTILGKNFIFLNNLKFYFLNSIWPSKLMFIHPKHIIDQDAGVFYILLSFILIFVLTYIYVRSLQKKLFQNIFLLILFFILVILPVSGFFEIYFFRFSNVAEHYLNLGLVPIFIFLIFIIKNIVNYNLIFKILLFLYLSILSLQTINYSKAYSNEFILMQTNAELNTNSALVWDLIGKNYKTVGDLSKSKEAFVKALQIEEAPETLYTLSDIYLKEGNLDQSLRLLLRASELNNYFAEIDNKIGFIYQKKGELQSSIKYFQSAIYKSPNNAAFYYNLSLAYEKNGDLENAMKSITSALKLDSENIIFINRSHQLKAKLN